MTGVFSRRPPSSSRDMCSLADTSPSQANTSGIALGPRGYTGIPTHPEGADANAKSDSGKRTRGLLPASWFQTHISAWLKPAYWQVGAALAIFLILIALYLLNLEGNALNNQKQEWHPQSWGPDPWLTTSAAPPSSGQPLRSDAFKSMGLSWNAIAKLAKAESISHPIADPPLLNATNSDNVPESKESPHHLPSSNSGLLSGQLLALHAPANNSLEEGAVQSNKSAAHLREGIGTSGKIGSGRLRYPVLWAAPFFSRSGYGIESISYFVELLNSGLISKKDLWLTQAGDHISEEAVSSLDPGLRQLLWDQEYRNITKVLSPEDRDRPIIVICHTFPDCWSLPTAGSTGIWEGVKAAWGKLVSSWKHNILGHARPPDTGCPCPHQNIEGRVVYTVGRTMFETERLPQGLIQYGNAVDELLVPSAFNLQSFALSGVRPPHGIHILPQGVNLTLFDAAAHSPLNLTTLEGVLVTGGVEPTSTHDLIPGSSLRGAQLQDGESLNPVNVSVQPHVAHLTADGALLGKHHRRQASEQHSQDGVTAPVPGQLSYTKAAAVTAEGHPADPFRQELPATMGGDGRVTGAWPEDGKVFRFASIFKWEARKGWDLLLQAFLEEFSLRDNAELHIITHLLPVSKETDVKAFLRDAICKLREGEVMVDALPGSRMGRKAGVTSGGGMNSPGCISKSRRRIRTFSSMPRIFIHTKYIPDSLYPSLYLAMDALVIPTHGEGWGRPQIEAMAMGLPVVSTNWSGLTAFMGEAVSYPIKISGLEGTGQKDGWFVGQQWAAPSLSHLRRLMRHVMIDPVDAKAKGMAAQLLVKEHFSTEAVAKKALKHIQRYEKDAHDLMVLGQQLIESRT